MPIKRATEIIVTIIIILSLALFDVGGLGVIRTNKFDFTQSDNDN